MTCTNMPKTGCAAAHQLADIARFQGALNQIFYEGDITPELGVFATKFCNSNGELGRLVDCF